jgi:hypothetical protein
VLRGIANSSAPRRFPRTSSTLLVLVLFPAFRRLVYPLVARFVGNDLEGDADNGSPYKYADAANRP